MFKIYFTMFLLLLTSNGYANNDAEQLFKRAEKYDIENNPSIAIDLYRNAIKLGHIKAKHKLALMYLQGKGVGKNFPMGKMWLEKAAEEGVSESQFLLGQFYWSGEYGITKNTDKSLELLEKASNQGHFGAKLMLVEISDKTEYVKKDRLKTIKYYKEAVLALMEKDSLKEAYDITQKLQDSELQQLASKIKLNIDNTISELQQFYDNKQYSDVITKGEKVKHYDKKIIDMIERTKQIQQAFSLAEQDKPKEAIDFSLKLEYPELQSLVSSSKSKIDNTISELQKLYDNKQYSDVISKGEKAKHYDLQIKEIVKKSYQIQHTLQLIQEGKLNEVLGFASKLEYPEFQQLVSDSKAKIDSTVSELQQLYDNKSYEDITKYEEKTKYYGDRVVTIINKAKYDRDLIVATETAPELITKGKYRDAFNMLLAFRDTPALAPYLVDAREKLIKSSQKSSKQGTDLESGDYSYRAIDFNTLLNNSFEYIDNRVVTKGRFLSCNKLYQNDLNNPQEDNDQNIKLVWVQLDKKNLNDEVQKCTKQQKDSEAQPMFMIYGKIYDSKDIPILSYPQTISEENKAKYILTVEHIEFGLEFAVLSSEGLTVMDVVDILAPTSKIIKLMSILGGKKKTISK